MASDPFPSYDVSQQLPKTDAEANLLKHHIAALLKLIPDNWSEFDPDKLAAAQSRVLFLLVAAGLVERRGRMLSEMCNHPVAFEATFIATGECGFDEAMMKLNAAEWILWQDAYREWKSGEQGNISPFHCSALNPQEWRLTDQGVIARSEISTGNEVEVFDFVLKRGFYGPGYFYRMSENTRYIHEKEIKRLISIGQNLATISRLPVQGSGTLVSYKKIEKSTDDLTSQTVNINNWDVGAEAFAKSFAKYFDAAINDKTTLHNQTTRNTAQAKGLEEPTYLFCNEGAVYRIRFNGEKGTIPTNLKGAKYIFEMLRQPNKAFLANELHALVAGMNINATDKDEASGSQEPLKRRCGADEGELLDLRRKLGQAKHELQRAQAENDNVEEIHCQEEIEVLNKRIGEMTGLGGKLRRTDLSERLGKTVSKSIDLIIRRCKENYNMPKLSAHLDGSIDRGRSCSYRPANPIPEWKF